MDSVNARRQSELVANGDPPMKRGRRGGLPPMPGSNGCGGHHGSRATPCQTVNESIAERGQREHLPEPRW